jgi:hypothetical protein
MKKISESRGDNEKGVAAMAATSAWRKYRQ